MGEHADAKEQLALKNGFKAENAIESRSYQILPENTS
jgi:hypothetical protein